MLQAYELDQASRRQPLDVNDVDMQDNPDQPPDNWPEGKDESWKSQHSPLTWDFTVEQNKRKFKWLQFLIDAPPTKMSMEKLVGSLVLSEIIRQEWYGDPTLKRQPKIVDVNYLLHPDKVNFTFPDKENAYGLSGDDIKRLHQDAFASTLAPSDTKINDCANSRQRSNHGSISLRR
jgi:hypothetical protein